MVFMNNTPKVETYKLFASHGRYIRLATQVTLRNGRVVKFLDKMPKGQAIKQALDLVNPLHPTGQCGDVCFSCGGEDR